MPPVAAIPSRPRSAQWVAGWLRLAGVLTAGFATTRVNCAGALIGRDVVGSRRAVNFAAREGRAGNSPGRVNTLLAEESTGAGDGGIWDADGRPLPGRPVAGGRVASAVGNTTCWLGSDAISQYWQADSRDAEPTTSKKTVGKK